MRFKQIAFCSTTIPPYKGQQLAICKGSLPPEYFKVVAISNGFATHHGFFRFFGIGSDIGFGDLYSQNTSGWIAGYGAACAGLIFFAEDIFGDRYAFSFRSTSDMEPSLVKFFCEGGELEVMPYLHLSDFLEVVLHKDTSFFDGRLAQAALQMGLRPTFDQHLAFKLPLITGGEYSLSNLGVEPAQMHLHVLAQMTEQMQPLRANTRIREFLAPREG